MLSQELYSGSYLKTASKGAALKALLLALGIGGVGAGAAYGASQNPEAFKVMKDKVTDGWESLRPEPEPEPKEPLISGDTLKSVLMGALGLAGAGGALYGAKKLTDGAGEDAGLEERANYALNQGKQYLTRKALTPYVQDLTSKLPNVEELSGYLPSAENWSNLGSGISDTIGSVRKGVEGAYGNLKPAAQALANITDINEGVNTNPSNRFELEEKLKKGEMLGRNVGAILDSVQNILKPRN